MEMKLRGEGQQSLLWTNATALVPQAKLLASETKVTNGYWGHCSLNSCKGSHFTMHLFGYKLSQPANFVIVSGNAAPVAVISWENEFTLTAAGLAPQLYPAKHFNMLYTPSGEFELQFKEKGNYRLLFIFLAATMLNEYEADCPLLHSFINNVNGKMSTALTKQPFFAPHTMIEVTNKIITGSVQSSLSVKYYDLLIREFLTLLADRVNQTNETLPIEWHYAEKARQIILQDFEVFHTVKQLARLCGTSDVALQQAFKNVFRQSVGKFSREVRLAEAYRLLSETDYPLRIICSMVGYNEAPNFFAAFKKQYGFTPGKIQQRGKNKLG